ncbi:MAG: thymidylate kinase [Terracidiphilus sp.]
MQNRQQKRQSKIVTFSGIDGAGKSTQIQSLQRGLEEAGLHVQLVAFWEDVARLKRIREGVGHSIFKGDKGVGSPSAPINRRDKNVRSSSMTGIRVVLYLVDAISTWFAVKKASRVEADVVMFDRYIYDEMANLSLRNPLLRAYVRLLLKLVPKPDISYLLDADPKHARTRKPEYPLDFLTINRQSYLDLSKMVDRMIVVQALSVDEVKRIVLQNAFSVFQIESAGVCEDGDSRILVG